MAKRKRSALKQLTIEQTIFGRGPNQEERGDGGADVEDVTVRRRHTRASTSNAGAKETRRWRLLYIRTHSMTRTAKPSRIRPMSGFRGNRSQIRILRKQQGCIPRTFWK